MRISALVLAFLSQLAFGQQLQTQTTVKDNQATIAVDFSSVSDLNGATITIRNSSDLTITQPEITNQNNLWPYSSADVVSQIPRVGTDQDIAIAGWKYIIDRTGYYCSAGTKAPDVGYITDPIRILNGHGFGCCDQLAATLAWVWSQLGFNARVARLSFHTIPEVYYSGAWHMMDPTHKTYYLKPDSTIASVADVIADTNLIVNAAGEDGKDPIGWAATDMAALYAQYGSTLVYDPVGYSDGFGIRMSLRPHEQFTLHDRNRTDSVQVSPDQYVPLDAVKSGQFDWDLSFGNPNWKSFAYAYSGVSVVPDSSGFSYLQTTDGTVGSITYSESSMFPVLALSVAAQVGSSSGSLQAQVSRDGVNWSQPISFSSVSDISSYQFFADLSNVASGYYTYFIRLVLTGNIQVHKFRVTPVVQVANALFPQLLPGTINALQYLDASNPLQGRRIEITSAVPTGNPIIRGVRATSLVPENAYYSLSRDTAAANLVDRDSESLAYPASTHVDYAIALGGQYYLTGISINWKEFGTDPTFVNGYSIYSRTGNGIWRRVGGGGFPGQDITTVNLATIATDIRIVADSSNSWIGIYEVGLFGTPLSPLAIVPSSVTSNVPENPTYSIAQGYGSKNLVDSDTNTFAYPAAFDLDYQFGFASQIHLNWVRVTWGIWGKDPTCINSWSILGRTGADQPWTTLASGNEPGQLFSIIAVDADVTDIRVVAHSTANWIGLAEVEFGGAPVVTPLFATSLVPEIQDMNSENVVNGDLSAIAYPGAFSFDYILDPGGPFYLDHSTVFWGVFGTDPSFIDKWVLLGLPNHSNVWERVAFGDFPNSSVTGVPVQGLYRKLRIAATSQQNWIGLGGIDVRGLTYAPSRPGRTPRN